jgi:hypothetical protein
MKYCVNPQFPDKLFPVLLGEFCQDDPRLQSVLILRAPIISNVAICSVSPKRDQFMIKEALAIS